MTSADSLTDELLASYALDRKGDRANAEAGYRAILAKAPRHAHTLNLLGVLLVNDGRAEEARALIRQAIAVDPTDPDSHINLGLAQRGVGQYQEALASFRTASGLAPRKITPLNYSSSILNDLGEFAVAAAAARAALRLDQTNVPALINLARSLTQLSKVADAIAAARRALDIDPGNGAAACALGEAMRRSCRYEEASVAYAGVAATDPFGVEATLGGISTLRERGDLTAASTAAAAAIARWPRDHRVLFEHAVLSEQAGQFPAAEESLKRSLEIVPGDAAALYQLIHLPDYHVDIDHQATLTAILNDANASRDQRRMAAFALARIAEKQGDYNSASTLLGQGHAIIMAGQSYDGIATKAFYRSIAAFAGARQAATDADQGPTPIFVIGLPRSGTSLCEQILASHPEITGMGESSFLQDSVEQAKALLGLNYPFDLSRLDAWQRAKLGAGYRGRLAGGTTTRFAVDKTPLNFQYVAFAKAILPDARFIACLRDPADNCLSIYRLPFDRTQTYAHAIDTLADHYAHYRELMDFWTGWLGADLLSVPYEEVVADLPGQASRILGFLGLPFDDAVLDFHRTERLVRTPSSGQVRQPIYRNSIAYWQRYGACVAPLAPLSGGYAKDVPTRIG